ncbi:MAG: hypothetical protein AB1451_15025 [Nitrospirota bacterium]
MESYIIRIYRRDANQTTRVEGIVEHVGTQQHHAFHSMQELVEALSAPRSKRSKEKNRPPSTGVA